MNKGAIWVSCSSFKDRFPDVPQASFDLNLICLLCKVSIDFDV